MIGQSLYYLNNKKYITNILNIETVIGELNSYYHTKDPRNIVVVHPGTIEDAQLVEAPIILLAEGVRTGAAELIEFKTFAEVSVNTYLQNSDKVIICFTDEQDMLNVYCRYISGLLTACGFYTDSAHDIDTIACNFIDTVVNADSILSMMSESDYINNAGTHCATTLANEDTPRFDLVYQNGKNFSYDLLFYLNDNYPCEAVANLIVEKFTIHSAVMAQDVMEHFTSRRHYAAYILSVIDYMNANATEANDWATDKKAWFTDVYVNAANAGNYQLAFYKLKELWGKVKDDADFIAVHQNKADTTPDGWEYMDLYTEINNVFPIVQKVLERNFDMENITTDLALINTDVQFFSKRQNRIPYLIHKYPLI